MEDNQTSYLLDMSTYLVATWHLLQFLVRADINAVHK